MGRRNDRTVSLWTPNESQVQLADSRTEGFIQAWAASPDGPDLQVLVRSAYLQGAADMAEVVIKRENVVIVEPSPSLEGL